MDIFKRYKIVTAVLSVLTLVGIGAWVWQLMNGLVVTGMSNANSWGLYIAMFMFFVGLSAGGLIVASSAHVFHIESFKQVAIPAVIVSLVSICVAGVFVLVDLGGVQRIWRMLTGPNFASPLVWDMVVITCYIAINVLDLMWLAKGDHRKVEILSRVALPVAILVHSVTAWIFGLQIAKAWYTAIMAPIFVASACDSGLALLLIVLLILDKTGLFKFDASLMKSLAGLLACFIAVDAFFIGCECLTMAYPGAHEAEALAIMATGVTAPFFWAEILLGLLVPFCILVFAKNRASRKLVTCASVLVVLGVLCKRIWLLFTSFVIPNLYGGPGIMTDGSWMLVGSYCPTLVEVAIVLGVISAGALGIVFLAGKLLIPAGKNAAMDAELQAAR